MVTVYWSPWYPSDTYASMHLLYDEPVSLLQDIKYQQNKENKKEKYHTFLVFHSGSIIQSGSGPEMENVYTKFVTILNQHRKEFEEILNTNNKQDIIKMQTLYNLKPGKKKITRHKNELDLSHVK